MEQPEWDEDIPIIPPFVPPSGSGDPMSSITVSTESNITSINGITSSWIYSESLGSNGIAWNTITDGYQPLVYDCHKLSWGDTLMQVLNLLLGPWFCICSKIIGRPLGFKLRS